MCSEVIQPGEFVEFLDVALGGSQLYFAICSDQIRKRPSIEAGSRQGDCNFIWPGMSMTHHNKQCVIRRWNQCDGEC
ncbi:hypothetical protein TIFTF001_004425 [Ficus carica]|uniref:Uncharacterized protein n=1 Tax=Ficus carica TaxID=3494 RepID=A0AA88A4G3_FICCA|nr:hypothetical protein TIFTF001_004425 [Ficus carica]